MIYKFLLPILILNNNLKSKMYARNKQDQFKERNNNRRTKRGVVYSRQSDQEILIFNKDKNEITKRFRAMMEEIEIIKSLPSSKRRKCYPFNQIIKEIEANPDGPFHMSDFYEGV
jgi:hypothetical protein